MEKEKLAKNTIVWFISDNGPWIIKKEEGGSAGLFRDGKGSTWEGGVRVPCIAYSPGLIPTSVNNHLVTAMDVYATNVWLGGYKIPEDYVMDGYNIASFLGYKGVSPKEDECYIYIGQGQKPYAIRLGKWKLHVKTFSQTGIDYFSGKLPLLFNLDEDPSEKYNLSDLYPEIVDQLKHVFEEKVTDIYNKGCYYVE